MRRALMVLALLGAGLCAPVSRPHDGGATRHGAVAIATDAGVADSAAIPEGGVLSRPLSSDPVGSFACPRAYAAGRGVSPAGFSTAHDGRRAAFRVRLRTSRHYTADDALARAGRPAFRTTTPPPCRVV